MSYENIEFAIDKGVARLTLNRPDSLNSFTAAMHGEVREVLTQAADDAAVRAVLITGNGRGFCAGQDLSDRAVAPGKEMPDLGNSVETYYNPLIRLITSMEKPVICAVNGVAAGAGANIALACDIVIAGRSASFIESFSKLGLIPDSGGTWILPRLVGMARAKGLAMLGPKIKAEQA
ncbi:MAG: enoyl-CoA hydratase-related protein, partial [Halieaceae bacterium]